MTKNKIIGLIIAITGLVSIILIGSMSPKLPQEKLKNQSQENQNTLLMSKMNILPEKIEVVHFHATQQCWSCITVGEYALKTITERFPEEYKRGIIVFRDINGELPENKDLVMRYKAGGSSLYINAITAGDDNIEEDVNVWRLVTNEKQFLDYLEAKIKKVLGGL